MRRVISLLFFACFVLIYQVGFSQAGVLDVNDPDVIFDNNNQPPAPPYNKMSKWGHTARLGWNPYNYGYKSYYFRGVAFRVKFPKTYQQGVNDGKKYPCFLFLHGLGEWGNIHDNEYQLLHGGQTHAQHVNNGDFDGILVYPQSSSGWLNSYDVTILAFLDSLTKYAKMDPDRVIVGGLSSGGQATWEFLNNHPERWAACTPISAINSASPQSLAWVANVLNIPVWVSNGGKDVAPYPSSVTEIVDEYENLGGDILQSFYPDAGHGVWNAFWAEQGYFQYLANAHKAQPVLKFDQNQYCADGQSRPEFILQPGFYQYEWQKDGVTISGAQSSSLTVNSSGTYRARFKRTSTSNWSDWSPRPVQVTQIGGDLIVPAAGSDTRIANKEYTDSAGWTHYYNDNGTPGDCSDDIQLLSIKKNGNSIGTVGDGTFQVSVVATAGAGSNSSVKIENGLVPNGDTYFSMNRYWKVVPTTQPSIPVGIRFYYNDQDLSDINGDIIGGTVINPNLQIYKMQDGNPDPTTDWAGASAVDFLNNGTVPSTTEWVYTQLDNNRNQAEFEVSSFSGGGAGVVMQSPLPVTFISFSAKAVKEGVVLQWSTAVEQNSKSFEVQRSYDGAGFETIGAVPAAGNSSSTKSYSYVDVSVSSLAGRKVYYRILQVDKDGKKLLSDVRHVNISGNGNALTLLYNPVKDEAVLHYMSTENTTAIIRVVDQLGRVQLTRQVPVIKGLNEIKLPTRNIAQGIYMAELISNKNRSVVSFLKE